MNAFVSSIQTQEARTDNGMKAIRATGNRCVDLFFKIGASRGKDIIPDFIAAYQENKDIALRIAQWARDVRGGAGERKIYRDILSAVEKLDADAAMALIRKTPEIGRWDDLLINFNKSDVRNFAFELIKIAIDNKNGLAAKWMPRKGADAVALRTYLGWSPKRYRKTLVNLTKVVEQQMCAKQWDEINFSHVPSLAASRYKKAFSRNTVKFGEYVQALVKGTDPTVKVNAAAVYPYDILKGVINPYGRYTKTDLDHITAQWNALPNFVGDANILPIVDVSGSMTCPAGRNGNVSCLDVSVSLGLYLADKNKGAFNGTFLTFSGRPNLVTLKGDIIQKITQMVKTEWEMNTNLVAAIAKVLEVAKKGKVPQEDMPKMLLVLSDMQFDACAKHDDSAMQSIERQYEAAGYSVPKIVFWNLNAAKDNAPVKFNKQGVALVSGFSPSILKTLLKGNLEQFDPEHIMLNTVMVTRYDL